MPPKPREARDGAATRVAILDIARSQFGSHGFERTTIRSVASAAGVDPALVMHYFGSKAELFAAASQFEASSTSMVPRIEPITRVSAFAPWRKVLV